MQDCHIFVKFKFSVGNNYHVDRNCSSVQMSDSCDSKIEGNKRSYNDI